MDQEAFLRLVRGETRGPLPALLRLGLTPLSWAYGVGASLRNRSFDRNPAEVSRAEVPVISVGNLTLGGTGKTPMVEWIARWFRERDVRVAILSRGYGGTEGLNDEGRVLAENLPDVPHLQDRDRVNLARIAVEELESQVLVLDDGFQHRRLGRDLDIVLLDALDPFGLGRIFPRGLLREPSRSLRRADLVVLSRADAVSDEVKASIRRDAERLSNGRSWIETRHAPRDLIDGESTSYPLSELAGKKVVAFCGIGNPAGFRQTLAGLGVDPAELRVFPDHHAYGAKDFDDLTTLAASAVADLALTTQKDLVKLRANALGRVPLRALRIGLEVTSGADALEAALARFLPPSD